MDPVNGQSLGGVELAVDEDHLLSCVARLVDVGAAGTGVTGLPHSSQSWGSVADTGSLMVLLQPSAFSYSLLFPHSCPAAFPQ